tara:strand:+ start:250 stop:480 length:231 start_codon:yes stop_codon:yes gene_type:complete
MTNTQNIIYQILLDGKPHSDKELRMAIDGEHTQKKTIVVHISNLRKELPKEQSLDIIRVVFDRKRGYRLVQLLRSN